MADRRGSRFAFEVLFLVALTVAVTVAELRPVVIAGVMLLGWLLVACVEWAAWRDEPHYSSGIPPRWYVPRVDLPPAQPLESVVSGYPEGRREEAATWIASAALREELLSEWPVAAPFEQPVPSQDAVEQDAVEQDAEEDSERGDEGWSAVELPPETGPDVLDLEPVPDPLPGPEPFPLPRPVPDPDPDPDPIVVPDLDPAAQVDPPLLDVELQRSAQGLAQYSLDPLAEQPRRRLGRRSAELGPSIIVPARPEGDRALPGSAHEE